MIVKFLGGLQPPRGERNVTLELPSGATVMLLRDQLRDLGYDPSMPGLMVTLNGKGIQQWPPDRAIVPGDDVAVFQRITGGAGSKAHGQRCSPFLWKN